MTPSPRSAAALALAAFLAFPAQAAPPKKDGPKTPKPATESPTATAVAVSTETPVSVLSAQLAAGIPAQEDAASRLARFMLSKSSTSAYVADKVKSDADALKRLNALPIVWVKKKIEAKQSHKVAMLYFVMGEDQRLGAWAKPFPILKRVEDPGTERAKILDTNLELYTADRAKAVKDNPSLASRYTGPYTGAPKAGQTAEAALEGWVTGFFDFGAERAEAILKDTRIVEEVRKAILANAEAPNDVPGVGGKKSRVELAEGRGARGPESFSAFDLEGCYERGGVTAYIPLDEKGKYRHISIKVYTVMEDGRPVNKLGIFDISEPGTPPNRVGARIFGQMFPMNQSGESVFRLDDRKPGTAEYKLVMGDNGSISFGNPGSDENMIQTSVNDLVERRKSQVLREGVFQTVNGITYRVIGQAGFRGGWLYFPADGAGGGLGGEAAGVTPSLVVETSQVGPDGRTERLSGPRPVGFVGKGAEGKPQFMYLLWNAETNGSKGAFEPKTCEELKARCDFPPPPKKKAKDDGKGGKDEGAGEGGKPPKPGKDKPEGGEGSEGGEETGGEEGGTGEDGHDIESGKPVFSKKCEIKASQFPGDSMRERTLSGWTLFVSQQKDHGNYAQFCMNGAKQQMFNVPGIVARADTKGGEVVVETFAPVDFIDPALLAEGWKVVSNEIVSGKHKFKLNAHYVYYIPLSALGPEAFDAVSEKGTAPVDKIARVKLDVDIMNVNATKRIGVYLRSAGNADRAVAAVRKALSDFAKESPLNAVDKHRTRLLEYIKTEAGRASGKKIELDAYATIVLYLSTELGSTGSESGGTDNYKEVIPTLKISKGLEHTKLVYCGVTGALETLNEHVSKGHVPK